MSAGQRDRRPSAIFRALNRSRGGFITAVVFSLFINLLAFVGSIYMLQIYDRVITSRNELTLLLLTLIAGFLLVVYALLEKFRSAVLVRVGVEFNENLRDDVFKGAVRGTLYAPGAGHGQALRDLDSLREFLTGNGFITFFDAPWVPIFVAACFILHPWFGYVALGGGVIIFALALLNELATRKPLSASAQNSLAANAYVSSTLRNVEVIQAMGMASAVRERWKGKHDKAISWQANASDRAGLLVASTKFVRQFLQIFILGVGAYLTIKQEVTGGAMIAASILMGRALAPVEAAVGSWRSFVNARLGASRINQLLAAAGTAQNYVRLPEPKGHLALEGVLAGPPGSPSAILSNVTFSVQAGETLGVIGPSAAGKSSLARVIVGVWPVLAGAVRLDGSELSHYDPEQLGRSIGYLPQDVELFSGTVAENIARLGEVDDEKVIEAARLAGVHEMIQGLPKGYNTPIGEGGSTLSGGQRQRIGLARAIYDMPALVVLDEPNSNLDSDGEAALLNAISALKEAKRTVVIVTHKTNILSIADKILLMAAGKVQGFGPRDAILSKVMAPANAAQIRRVATSS